MRFLERYLFLNGKRRFLLIASTVAVLMSETKQFKISRNWELKKSFIQKGFVSWNQRKTFKEQALSETLKESHRIGFSL